MEKVIDSHVLEARLAALELMMFALVGTQPAAEFKKSYFEAKEEMFSGLTYNPEASDKMYAELLRVLSLYERALCLSPE